MMLPELTYEDLRKQILNYNPKANIPLIKKAFDFAKEAHKGQKRASGEDYLQHLIRTAYTLADLKLNSVTIAAGLLHDILEDTKTRPERLEDEFGEEILELVKGVTKITSIKFESREEKLAENIRKVLFATAKDIRVILIKLADRLHNMQTLEFNPKERQVSTAQETLDIYVPIAHKLGIYKIKSEMEDLCLQYLHPEDYKMLVKKVEGNKDEREKRVKELIKEVKDLLKESNIITEAVQGRAKSYYSVYNKLNKRGKEFEEIYDLVAIRIITKNIEDCYKVLGIVHSNWPYVQSQFKDYIANPKPNGYQSIHTQIMFQKKPVEIQIRTLDMHREAEDGIAAHWRYKGTDRDKKFDRKINWLKQIFEWKGRSDNAIEFIETLKIDLFKDEIVVITPKGEPISLPEGSTPVDYAYEIHSKLGNSCARAKVNNVIKPLDYKLQSGDIVDIVTQSNAKPSRQWLNFVKTNHAKSKIKQALGIQTTEKKKSEYEDDKIILDKIISKFEKKNLSLSNCCEIKIGEPIIGFKTKDNKIHVHSANCPNMNEFDQSKICKIDWDMEKGNTLTINILAGDRIGLAADVLNVISGKKINIRSINTKDRKTNALIAVKIDGKELSEQQLKILIGKIKAVPNVLDVNVI
ncbi:MAG: RelA/SpoT family protein [Candidatus Woesearchaeota archaeon]